MDTVDRIFELLDHTTMEQQEFARLVGVSDDTASNWRRRKSASYAKWLPKIAEVLGTTTDYLLTGAKKEPGINDTELSPGEKSLINLFRLLTEEQQAMVVRVVEAAAGTQK